MKKCTTCKKIKKKSEFGNLTKNKDGLQNKCLECKQGYDNNYYHKYSPDKKVQKQEKNRIRYEENQSKLLGYLKNGRCPKCGEDDLVQLRFISKQTNKEVQIRKHILQGMVWGKVHQKIEGCHIECKACVSNKSVSKIKVKIKNQLGVSYSTASNKLIKDLLFMLSVKDGHTCFRCGGELTRDTFTIDHKVPWRDSIYPVKLFFDLENIAFSHLACNSKAARQPNKKYFTKEEIREANNKRSRESRRRKRAKEKEKEKFKIIS